MNILYKKFDDQLLLALEDLLQRATSSKPTATTMNALEIVANDCTVRENFAVAPRLFTLAIGTENLRFDYRVQANTMYMNG